MGLMWADRRRSLYAALSISAVVLAACEPPAPVKPQPAFCSAAIPHFSAGTFDPDARFDAFTRDWYSKHLKAMGEPSFQCESPHPAYRFLWLRTFHRPIAIRVEMRSTGTYLSAVELDGAGGYAPGEVSRRIERVLDEEQVRDFHAALAKAEVWLPLAEEKMMVKHDGAQWVVEARDGKRYLLHDHWSPDQGRVREMGMAFLALTDWRIRPDQLY